MKQKDYKFPLGVPVIDKLTGVTGILNAVIEWNNGNIQYSIQRPADKDGNEGESKWADTDHMVVAEEKCDIEPIEVDPKWHFNFGDKVKVKHVPYKGSITARCLWINGCYRYTVCSEKLHEGKTVSMWFDDTELSLVKKNKEEKPAKEERKGGPSSISSYR